MRKFRLLKIFILVVLFFNYFKLQAKVIEITEKEIRNGIVYQRGEKNSFTGTFQGNGRHEEYKNGIKHGKFKGKLQLDNEEYNYEGNYIEGIKHGEWVVKYLDGKIQALIEYNYDLPKGQWTYFYPNNKIKGYENFENGVLSGNITLYGEEGNLLKKVTYKNGLLDGELLQYYTNNTLETVANFSSGRLEGPIKVYSPQNVIQLEGYYKNDKRDSLWKLYYANGDLKIAIAYKNGLKNGRMVIYGKAGEVVQVGIYRDDNEVDEEGVIVKKAGEFKDNIALKLKNINQNLEYLKYNRVLSDI